MGGFQTGSSLGDNWGAETSPSGFELTYAQTADQIAPGIVDYARQFQTAGESLIEAISRARMTLAMSDAQRELLQVQIDRARQGLPPLQTTQYTGGVQGINNQTLILVALALGVLILMTRKS
jgi:hypothetical protein